MYTENDLKKIVAQQKKRWSILAIPVAVCAAALIYAVAVHQQMIADAATIVLGVVLIAGWDLFIKPLHRYEIHLRNVLQGVTHELECEYGDMSEDLSEVEGVVYRTMTVICYDEKDKPYDRMFYYDNLKPMPALQQGQKIRVVYHDHELGSVTAI